MSPATRPFSVRVTDPFIVSAPGPYDLIVEVEVEVNKWLANTGRYRTVYSARKPGRFSWDASSSLRGAIARATYLRPRSTTLRLLVERAEAELKTRRAA